MQTQASLLSQTKFAVNASLKTRFEHCIRAGLLMKKLSRLALKASNGHRIDQGTGKSVQATQKENRSAR